VRALRKKKSGAAVYQTIPRQLIVQNAQQFIAKGWTELKKIKHKYLDIYDIKVYKK
jgi:hypothetical protein